MALTITPVPFTQGGDVPGIIIASALVLDVQNTAEILNVDLGSIPPHKYNLLKAVLHGFGATDAQAELAGSPWAMLIQILSRTGEVLDLAVMQGYLTWGEDEAMAVPKDWLAVVFNPFFQSINPAMGDSIQIGARPADANAAPSGGYSLTLTMGITPF